MHDFLQDKIVQMNLFSDVYNYHIFYLTLCLLVLSADYHCKQFGPRSGPTNVGPDLDPNYLTMMVRYSRNIFEKVDYEKISRQQKSMQKFPVGKELISALRA